MTHLTRPYSDAHSSRAGRRTSSPAAVVTVLIALTCADWTVHGQDRAGPRVRFEVASVRPNISSSERAPGSGSGGPSIGVKGRRFTAVNAPLRDLIRYGYQLEPLQPIEGGSRLLDDRFDIAAVVPESTSGADAPRRMLQTLLAERFNLTVRWVTREEPVYTLRLARRDGRLGPALKQSTIDCDAQAAMRRQLVAAGGEVPSAAQEYARERRPICDMVYQPFRAAIQGSARTMSDLAHILSRLPAVGLPVLDRTGLTPAFDFDLVFAPNQALSANAADASSSAPSVFVALEEQLGLRLEKTRGPVEVLAIDRVERLNAMD